MGNPKYYSCFTDESLNIILRSAVQYAHRSTMEIRVFRMFHLRGVLQLGQHIFSGNVDPDNWI